MDPAFKRKFERIEAARRALLDRLAGVDDERLNRRPGGDRWSIAQVVCHLIVAEELSLDYVRKKMQAEKLPAAGPAGWVRSKVLALAMCAPVKFKAPPRSSELPERQELAVSRRQWDAVRAGWRELLEDFPARLAGKAVFRHPAAGLLSLGQTLDFMADHLRRHSRQIDGLLAESTAGS